MQTVSFFISLAHSGNWRMFSEAIPGRAHAASPILETAGHFTRSFRSALLASCTKPVPSLLARTLPATLCHEPPSPVFRPQQCLERTPPSMITHRSASPKQHTPKTYQEHPTQPAARKSTPIFTQGLPRNGFPESRLLRLPLQSSPASLRLPA